ncbi:tetratricopeptide repeat protein [Marimonas lutisalis]|uniref:tetratricopeptide repeat protein n=1 Tax=Marimonas lutisalis TaxID=2545756 RepID=UPI0010F6E5B2|nr:tetratricopeptide repeat protein [Marimonas lutisalis]
MSDTDSFIDEVTEEVRRDRLFRLMKRYGWIAVLAVLVLVGGAAFNEYRKAQATRAAQETGDAMIAALRNDDPLKRAEALTALAPENAGAQAVAALLAAGEQVNAGEFDAAAQALAAIEANADLPLIYRQIALFKKLAVQAGGLSVEERRQGYESLIGPNSRLRLMAEEQLALIDIETGDTEAALERLKMIASDAGATAGLRRRATQLMVALGAEPETGAATAADAATNGG